MSELYEILKPADMFAARLKLPYHDTQDAAQEARIAVWRAWGSGKTNVTYLRVVAKNGALRHLRGRVFGVRSRGGSGGSVKHHSFADPPPGAELAQNSWYPSNLDWAYRVASTPAERSLIAGVSQGFTPTEVSRMLGYGGNWGGNHWRPLRAKLQQAWKETQE